MKFLIKRMSIIEIIIIVLICVLLILLIMQISTNSIMQELESAFLSTDYYIDESVYAKNPELYDNDNIVNYVVYKKDPKFYNIYARYNVTADTMRRVRTNKVQTDLKLHRVFTWHNFNKGTLWINYSVSVTNSASQPIRGSWDVPVKFTIERVNGKWGVTDIDEAP